MVEQNRMGEYNIENVDYEDDPESLPLEDNGGEYKLEYNISFQLVHVIHNFRLKIRAEQVYLYF